MKVSTRNNILLLVAICVVICIYLIIKKINQKTEPFAQQTIPKQIWAYWDSDIPASVQLCMNSWKKYAPNYTITLLNKSNVKKYMNLPDSIFNHPNFNDFPARFADLLRLHLLTHHGGLWVDASILMSVPLDTWLSLDTQQEFFGYYSDKHTQGIPPVVENWFLVSKPNSPFIKAWYEEFLKMAKFPTVAAYIQSRRDMGVNTSSLDAINYTEYLAAYVACEKVLQVDKYPLTTLKLWKAEEGPQRYSHELGWNVGEAMPIVCKDPKYRQPMIKFTKSERKYLEDHINGSMSNETCQWI